MKILSEQLREVDRFLADEEENTIAQFMDIAGFGDEWKNAMKPNILRNDPIETVMQDFANRGYKIGGYHNQFSSIDADVGMNTKIFLLHDEKVVAYKDIVVKIGHMKTTECGRQKR